MLIRKATPGDIPALSTLYNQFHHALHLLQPDYVANDECPPGYVEQKMQSSGTELFVAEQAGEILGFLLVRSKTTPGIEGIVPHRYAKISDLMVAPQHRGKGVAKALMAYAESWAKEQGFEYIALNVFANNGAHALYKEQGYEDVRVWMKKPLT